MIPNPILKVLSTMNGCHVRALLMGGQACVLYGAAEFSRDVDFAILADASNLRRLRRALDELQAEQVNVPPLSLQHLVHGHSIHFRCHIPAAEGLRVDVMAKMRGVAPFPELWKRRTTVRNRAGETIEVLALPDLVHAKKTQSDKDWPMLRRLLEADYAAAQGRGNKQRVEFWLRELRTPQLLSAVATAHPKLAGRVAQERPLLEFALKSQEPKLREALAREESVERQRDRTYWQPLKAELEKLRHSLRGSARGAA